MRLWDSLRALLFAVFRRSEVDAEMDEELRAHIERRAEDLARGGMTPADASRRARIEFGGIESVKEKVRDLFWETYFDTLLRDARYAARSLCRDRGFALTAIFALALGVGSTPAWSLASSTTGCYGRFPTRMQTGSRRSTFMTCRMPICRSLAEAIAEALRPRSFLNCDNRTAHSRT